MKEANGNTKINIKDNTINIEELYLPKLIGGTKKQIEFAKKMRIDFINLYNKYATSGEGKSFEDAEALLYMLENKTTTMFYLNNCKYGIGDMLFDYIQLLRIKKVINESEEELEGMSLKRLQKRKRLVLLADEIIDNLDNVELPKLTGSEKQVAWAEEIRRYLYEEYKDFIYTLKYKDDIKQSHEKMLNVLLNTDAKYYIDNKNISMETLLNIV